MSKKEKKKEEPKKVEELGNIETIELQQEIKEHQDKYMRLLAESENSRKRMQKEKEDMMRYAVENVIAEFLGPLDNLESALSFATQSSDETKKWAIGFEMILTQFKDILSQHNITPFSSAGATFDPHLHEAIEMEETDTEKEGKILHEFLRGYKCGERVLRPARVKVAKSPKKTEEIVTGEKNV